MTRKFNSQQHQRLMSNMEDQIHQLKNITSVINKTLNEQKSTRDSLGDYLDKGSEALTKINSVLNDLGSRYSFFGCNGLLVVGIALVTILILALF